MALTSFPTLESNITFVIYSCFIEHNNCEMTYWYINICYNTELNVNDIKQWPIECYNSGFNIKFEFHHHDHVHVTISGYS